jgi:probable F420-dependent oxidoreductase
MKFGLFAPLPVPIASAEYLKVLGHEADGRGIDTLWLPEHVVMFDDYTSKYNLTENGEVDLPRDGGPLGLVPSLAFLAAATENVRLATGICLLAQRNPVYAAKDFATADWLSGGRIDVGVGLGWSHEEYEAAGADFSNRGEITDEHIDILRALWRDDPSSFSGKFNQVPECRMHPKPLQPGSTIPIYIGGVSTRALRRVAEKGDGWFAINLAPDDVRAAVDALVPMLEENGRTLDDVEIVLAPHAHPVDDAAIAEYAAAGVNQLCPAFISFGGAGSISGDLDALAPVLDGCRAA